MSQFLWMINVIPDSVISWIINTMIIAGIVCLSIYNFISILQFFPYLIYFKPIVYLTGCILLLLGVYFKGMHSADSTWKEKVAEMQEKVRIAEEKSKKVNTVIQKEVVTKIKYIRDNQQKTEQLIKNLSTSIDSECILDPQVLFILNESAKKVYK